MQRYSPATVLPEHLARAEAIWFVFQDGNVLVSADSSQFLLPEIRDIGWFGFDPSNKHYLGTWDGKPTFALNVDEHAAPPEGFYFEDLRKLLVLVDRELFDLAGRAIQVIDWRRKFRFCGACGVEAQPHPQGERAMVCPQCQHASYPRINPCVITVITRGEELLLARSTRFTRPMYSALAGFVEAGESLEATLHREVKEEVGVDIKNIRYFGSQPWPFPNSLMVGFHAEYAGGELVLQEDEILDAQFYHYTQLPMIPPHGSIAHDLIMDVVKKLEAQ